MLETYGKRVLSFVMALVMVFSMVPAQAFATETVEEEHEHCAVCGQHDCICPPEEETHVCDFVAGEIIAPTCGAAGYTVYTCAGCGAVENRDEVPATGAHTYVEAVVGPTETEQGYTAYSCNVCGDSYKDHFVDPIATEPVPTATEEVVEEEPVAEEALSGQTQREIPASWTDEMVEIQELIDIALEDWLVWYGFEMPDQDKFADLIRAEIYEEEIPEELEAEWEVIRAQIEDVVVNKMTDNERENATTPIKEVEYLLTLYTEEGLLSEKQLEALIVFNPVFWDFADLVFVHAAVPTTLDLADTLIGVKFTDNSGTLGSFSGSASGTGITATATCSTIIKNSGDGTITITNNRPFAITLEFSYSITGTSNGKGAVSSAISGSIGNSGTYSGTIASGKNITIKVGSGENAKGDTCKLTISNIVAKATVTFNSADNGTYTVTGGNLSGAAAPTSDTAACTTSYTVTATPATGYTLKGWCLNGSTDVTSAANPYSFTIDDARSITPVFEIPIYTTTFKAPVGTGSYTVNGTAWTAEFSDTDASFALVASHDKKQKFVGWYDGDGNLLSSDLEYSYMVSADGSIYPKFEDLPLFDITVEYDANGGTVTGAGVDVGIQGLDSVLTATANSGWTFLGWTDTDGKILGTSASYTVSAVSADTTLKAAFANASADAWFKVGTMTHKQSDGILGIGAYDYYLVEDTNYLFQSLTAAADYAKANSLGGIVLAADGTLPAGDYTIPDGISLLIPYESTNRLNTTLADYDGSGESPTAVANITAYRTLNMAAGANISIASGGAINVNAKIFGAGGSDLGGGSPLGSYGYIKMQSGSNITLQSGGKLYCYGYIGGSGSVTAKSGSTVYEVFSIERFRGGSVTSDMATDETYGIFPMNAYSVQNVMVPLTLESGSVEYAFACLYMNSMNVDTNVLFIGSSNSMFNMESGSSVTKAYDYATDRVIVTANSGALALSNIDMSISSVSLNSAGYDLPISGNFTIVINDGSKIKVNQDVALLPGAEIKINDGAACELTSGYNLFVYDMDQWPTETGKSYSGSYNEPFNAVYFVPERQYTRKLSDLKDVLFEVAGDIMVSGNVYTTGTLASDGVAATGGAAIKGVEGAHINMKQGDPDNANHYQMIQGGSFATSEFVDIPLTDARLMNADGSYTDPTKICPTNGTTYTYTNGVWVAQCNTVDGVSGCEQVLQDTTAEFSCKNPYICKYCGTVMKTTGHTEGDAATCTTPQTCTVCGETLKEALGHTYKTVTGEADTCVAGDTGYLESQQCTRCNLHFSDTNGTLIGDGSDEDYEAWKTDDGVDDSATHTAGKEYVIDESTRKASTCTVPGSYEHYLICTVTGCGVEIEGSRETVTLDLAAHNYVDVDGEADTCKDGDTGYKASYKCEVCKQYFAEKNAESRIGDEDAYKAWTLDPNGGLVNDAQHTEGAAATCTTSQVCTVCNATLNDKLGHSFTQWKKGEELDENSYYQTSTCDNGCGTTEQRLVVNGEVVQHSGVEQVEPKPASCTEAGYEAYWMCTDVNCQVCSGTYVAEYETYPALGHTLEDSTNVSYTWNDDYTVCTASGPCGRNCGATHSVTSEKVEKTGETAATCDDATTITYKATFAVDSGVEAYSETVTVGTKLGHDWTGTVEYTDLAGAETCTATLKCKNDENHVQTETVNVTTTTISASCTTAGYTTYKADFNATWAAYQSVTVEGDAAKGHTYTVDNNTVVWITVDGEMNCTASLKCNTCDEASAVISNVAATVTVTSQKAATCTEAGQIVYSAAFAVPENGNGSMSASQAALTNTVTLDVLDHDYRYTYTWAEDKSTCTATRVCQNDVAHTDTETVASVSSGGATCTAEVIITYTATFVNENGEGFEVQTETVEQAALGHDVEAVAQVDPTCQKTGVAAHYKCTREGCGLLFKTEDGAKNNNSVIQDSLKLAIVSCSFTNYTEKTPATCTANKIETASCDYNCGKTADREVANTKLDHAWGEYTYVEGSATCETDGTKTASCTYGCDTTNTITAEGTKLGHSYTEEVLVAATCTTNGTKELTCTNTDCGNSYTEDISALGHVYDLVTGRAATCYAEGWNDYYQCAGDGETRTYCGLYFAHENDTASIDLESWKTGDGKIEKADHEYESVVTAPTCLEKGYTTYTCKNCPEGTDDHSYVDDYVDALDHKYDDGVVTTKPTCTAAGVKTFTCQNECCTEQTEGHTTTESVDALGHSLVKIDGQDTTCVAAGWKDYYQCAENTQARTTSDRSYCGYYFANATDTAADANAIATTDGELTTWKTTLGENGGAIAQLEHVDANNDHKCDYTDCEGKTISSCADADSDHLCDYEGCKANMSSCVDDNPKDHECDYSGCTEILGEHADANDDNDHLCDYCQAEIGDHEYTDGTCNCGYVQDLTVNITIKADGQEDQKMAEESIKYMNANADYADYTKTLDFSSYGNCYTIQSVTAKVGGEEVESTYEGTTLTIAGSLLNDNVEIVVTAKQNHQTDADHTSVTITDATCVAEGKKVTVITCKNCGTPYDSKEEVIPAKDHDWEETYVDPTFDADGYWNYHCKNDSSHDYQKADEGTKLIAVAQFNGTKYQKLDDAIEAAEASTRGGLLELLTKVTVDDTQTWSLGKVQMYIPSVQNEKGEEIYGLVIKGDLTIESGTYYVEGMFGIGVTGKLTIDGGTFEVTGDNDYLIGSWGTTVINDGTFKGQYCCVNGFAGSLTINAGTFTTEDYDCTGKYESFDVLAEDGVAQVKVGTFSKSVEGYLAEGHCERLVGSSYYVAPHSSGDAVEENAVAATCTTAGSYDLVTYCTRCDAELSREAKTVDALGHTVTTVDGLDATCTTDGYKEAYYCSVCEKYFATKISDTELADEIEGELSAWQTTENAGKIGALGHDLTKIDAISATCKGTGVKEYWPCSRCPAAFEDEKETTSIADLTAWKAEGGNGYIDAIGHSYTSEVTTDPTCENEGVRTYTCQNDKSHTYTEVEPKLNHKYVVEYNWNEDRTACTASAVCENNANHKAQMNAVVTVSVTTEAGCETKGAGIRTAAFTANNFGIVNQVEDVVIPATDHSFTKYVADGNATCTEDGTKTASCDNNCGKTDTVDNTGAALGHNMDEIAAVDATCTKEGNIHHYYCLRCLNRFYDQAGQEPIAEGGHIIAALKHDYQKVVTDPTCEAKGYTTYTCSLGDSTYVSEYMDALGHDYDWDDGKVVTDPTCEDKGYTTYNCSRCDTEKGDYVGDYTAALGHDKAPAEISGQSATCEAAGWKASYKCETCGVYFENKACTTKIGDEAAWTEWKTTGNGVISALGHNVSETVDAKKPACETSGYLESYQCSRCKLYYSDMENETLIGDGSEEAWNTWIAEGGDGYIKPNGHTDGEVKTENVVAPKCEEVGSHDEVIYCTVCTKETSRKTVVDSATGHENITAKDGKDPNCTTAGYKAYWQCGDCNVMFSDAEGKTVIAERVTIPATGHNKDTVIEAVEATCTVMGKTEGKKCSVCGTVTEAPSDVQKKEHDLTDVISRKDATCTQDGERVVGCANCDYETKETLKATGHQKPLTAKDGQDPNCTDAGYEAYWQCGDCNVMFSDAEGETIITEKVEIPATGHDYKWDGGNIVTAPTCTAQGYTTHICQVCKYETKDTYTAKADHTAVIDAAVPATCTATGLTEGKHCANCPEVMVKQQIVDMVPHTEVIDAAVPATCTATGLTEGKHCANCPEVMVAQEVVNAKGHSVNLVTGLAAKCEQDGWKDYYQCKDCGLYFEDEAWQLPIADLAAWKIAEDGGKIAQPGHTWDDGRVTTLPTCTEDGVRTYTCGTCNGTKTDVEAMLGHETETHAAQHPTYYSAGWKEYETCTRSGCEYSTFEAIEALGEPSVGTFEEFMTSLKLLEEYANAYVKANPGKDPLWLLIKYVRTGVDRYNSGSWNIMAGYEDEAFADYVMKQEEAYNKAAPTVDDMINVTGIKNIKNFTLPNGDSVDFGHMFGTMDITYHNKTSINHADVAGWAGDLVDLLSTADRHDVTGTVDEMIKVIGETYLTHSIEGESDQFSQTDMYGDLDGYYFMNELLSEDYENGMLYSMMSSYFVSSLTDEQRADYFLKNRLGGVTSRSDIRDAVFSEYTGNSVIATLEGTREFKQTDVSDMRKACCYAFADYLCKLAGDYVELDINKHYTIYSTEKSTLAPGITQEIHKGTTTDNENTVFYVVTADVNNPYVNVYANYNDADPSKGWAMQRVLDQANAAQARYGDPDSPDYIKNYNVIASTNGAGYDMSTGEPGGVLMMGGVEYHAPNGNGFFGIRKDGTPCMGSDTEYYALKEKGELSEAIAIFGTTLVKDGKINVSTNDYNRASRTAIGYTKTGKVVLMVMDGRQVPVSCGGSMAEIAQVMLEAGCVWAVNMDGGGSSTYVAKQEGEDELSLVSTPSDGYMRSVSTSWLVVSTAPSSTEFDHAVLNSDVRHMTIGASVQVTASGVSATGNAVELPEGVVWAVSDESIASISADGVVIGKANGQVDVQLKLDDQVVGSRTMYVVIPDAVYFTKENMNAVYGEPATLPVAALYEGKSVAIVEEDVYFTLSNETAGTTEGFTFIGIEESNIKNVKINAHAVNNENATSGAINVNLYKPGEASFDFDNADGGDRLLAWNRVVSNSTTVDSVTYTAVDKDEPMITEYTFAMDMTQIPMPEELTDLVYMLPGADVEGNNSAWSFLLQLAERVSVLTEVKATLQMDPNFDVDYSEMTVNCEYFALEETIFDAETNELILSLRWKDQTKAIDPDTANPIVILAGIKLTPKDDAAWDAKDRLTVVNSGNISYDIYLRANALYTFACKPENQEAYKLYPFVNEDVLINGAPESGGHFSDIYKEFNDEYTLNKGEKNGWVYEDGGYAYYEDGEKYTGVRKVGQYYYDFGETGINIGQTKYSGMFVENGKNCYAKNGVPTAGWVYVGEDRYCFDENGVGYDGDVEVDEVELTFDNGLMTGGYTGFVEKSNGKTYHYIDGISTRGWYNDGEYWYFFFAENGIMITGTHVTCHDRSTYYDFDSSGRLLRGYFNGSGYYYWAGEQLADSWVKAGNDSDPDAWYRTNSHGHFVTDTTGKYTYEKEIDGITYTVVNIAIDGVIYTFDNTNGKLLLGNIAQKDDMLYFYWAGEPVNDGWFDFEGETYYAYEDGHLATGSHVIDGESYMFTTQGTLITEGTMLSVTMNDDLTQMTIKTSQLEGLSGVTVAVWSEASSQEDLVWFEATDDGTGIWTVVIEPMCQYKNTGKYHLHAYEVNENGGYGDLLVATTYDLAEIGHITGEPVKQNVVAPTCTTDGGYDLVTICEVCDETVATEHVVESATGHTLGDPVKQNVVTPTCTEDGSYDLVTICKTCNETIESEHVVEPAIGGNHVYDDNVDGTCNSCGIDRATVENRQVVHMLRMYNPYTGEHFYTGSEVEKNDLVAVGWNYEGVAFTFPANTGAPVYRLYDPITGEHLYTMDEEEKASLMEAGWNYEGIAFNSAYDTEAVQHRLHNPYASVGAYHFTYSIEERDNLIAAGWEYQGIGWYSCFK